MQQLVSPLGLRRAAAMMRSNEDLDATYQAEALAMFVREAWPIIEAGVPLKWNWHLDVICDELVKVSTGDTKRLLINIPPATMKSLLVSVFWPAYEWSLNPRLRYLCASYGAQLSMRDNVRLRRIVRSSWYQSRYSLRMAADQDAKGRFNTTAGGWRVASSVGGVGTGEHPDRVIIDDPHTAEQARSDIERQRALDWFDRTISSRGVARDVRVVVIMQRLHEQDLSGHLLDKGGWKHLMLPMRFDANRADPRDTRTRDGDLLWPALFDEQRVRRLEIDLGPYGAAGQLQQRPAPEGGGLFKREWFRLVDAPPVAGRRCRGWDTASVEGGGDYTVGTLVSQQKDGKFYVEHVARMQGSPRQVDDLILQCAQADGRSTMVREEREGGSAGQTVIAARSQRLAGFDYAGVRVTGDKVTRARPFRAQCEAGNVALVQGEWNREYLDELSMFPTGRHDDQVDSTSCAFNALTESPPGRIVKIGLG